MRWAILGGMIWLCGCGDAGCEADQLEPGAVTAVLDGQTWEGTGASFLWQGEGVQVNTTRENGWMLSMKVDVATDGMTLREAVDGGSLPVEVALDEEGLSGWLTAYPEEGGSYLSKKGNGGTLVVTALDDARLTACFDLQAAAGDGTLLEIASGQINAEVME